MFDYIYYRLYKMYKDKEGDTQGVAAAIALSTFQFVIIGSVFIMFNTIFPGANSWLNETGEGKVKIIGVSFGIIVMFFNYFYYKKRREKIIAKYENHPANRWFRPWMLYIVALMFIALPILCWQLFG